MTDKIKALFTTATGLSHVLVFLIGLFTYLGTHGVVWGAGVVTILTAIGMVFFPTEMIGGKKVSQ